MYFNQLKFNCAQLRISIYLDLQLVCLLVSLLKIGLLYGFCLDADKELKIK